MRQRDFGAMPMIALNEPAIAYYRARARRSAALAATRLVRQALQSLPRSMLLSRVSSEHESAPLDRRRFDGAWGSADSPGDVHHAVAPTTRRCCARSLRDLTSTSSSRPSSSRLSSTLDRADCIASSDCEAAIRGSPRRPRVTETQRCRSRSRRVLEREQGSEPPSPPPGRACGRSRGRSPPGTRR